MPVSIGVQWPSEKEAWACKKGDLRLVFCRMCGFIWNKSFDPARLEYSQRYDNSLDYSPVFENYARALAKRLIDTYNIRRKQVVELGCGKGHFLALLCETGDNDGVGFDPSYEGERIQSPAAGRIQYLQDFYSEKYTGYHGDLICCRHVFEHIPDPVQFLSMVRRTIGDRQSAVVYFEVPNVRLILERLSIWDIIYEHCSYFSHESLGYVFRRCGFRVLGLRDGYDRQFLSTDAILSPSDAPSVPLPDLAEMTRLIERFSDELRVKFDAWKERLKLMRASPGKTVIWGGGAKTVTFLNMLEIREEIRFVVDINPHKQGLHLAGTGQRIVAPEFLKEFQPEAVILMNSIYQSEVQKQLTSLGLNPELMSA